MMEKIGNVVMNYDYYSGTDLYSDGDIEDTLLDLASYAIMTLEHIRGLK